MEPLIIFTILIIGALLIASNTALSMKRPELYRHSDRNFYIVHWAITLTSALCMIATAVHFRGF